VSSEYFDYFLQLFKDGEVRLRRILSQKLRSILNCKSAQFIMEDEETEFKNRFKKSQTARIIPNNDEQAMDNLNQK